MYVLPHALNLHFFHTCLTKPRLFTCSPSNISPKKSTTTITVIICKTWTPKLPNNRSLWMVLKRMLFMDRLSGEGLRTFIGPPQLLRFLLFYLDPSLFSEAAGAQGEVALLGAARTCICVFPLDNITPSQQSCSKPPLTLAIAQTPSPFAAT